MKLPRVRLTVRRMMVLVAVTAALLGPFAYLRSRSARLRAIQQRHATMAQKWGLMMSFLGGSNDPAIVTEPMSRLRYHKQMSRKYDLAARSPWLPVVPDPPEPK